MKNTQHEFIQGFAITILTVAMSVTFLFFLFGCFEDTSDHEVSGTTSTTSSSSSGSSDESTSTTGIDPSTSTGSTTSSSTSETGSESTDESSTGEPEHTCCDMTIFPGCGDAMIEACVCAVSDYCCETAWDGVCVQTGQDLGCLICP